MVSALARLNGNNMKEITPNGPFPHTRWSLVDRAATAGDVASTEALGQLLERYLPALKTHLICRRRLTADQADDLLQKFIAEKVLQGNLIERADRERGKFRTFLLTSLERFWISEIRKEQAACRAPDIATPTPLHELLDRLPAPGTTDVAAEYNLAWAREVIQQTLARVETECRTSGRPHFWTLFECRVLNPIFNHQPVEPYSALMARLDFASPIQAASALSTVKRMFRRCLRDVVGEYAADEKEVDDEIRELNAILASSMPPPTLECPE